MADLMQNEWSSQLESDDNAVILDVRTQEEVDEGRIPKSLHMDIYKTNEFLDKVKQLDPSKNYYVYCRAGSRSAQACAVMNQLGFKNTYNLVGGISQWNGTIE